MSTMFTRGCGILVAAFSLSFGSLAAIGGPASAAGASASPQGQASSAAVCAAVPSGYARCHSRLLLNPQRAVANSSTATHLCATATGATPSGYYPCDLRSAYNLTSGNLTQTVAIVDAYDDPNAASDLAVYRSTFGLPACTATGSPACFTKVNQAGSPTGPYPTANGGWAQEISLDLDMVSAICPSCRILLVEASSNSYANLGAAVDTAAALGATAISNSYGGGEFSGETSTQSHYNHPGIAVTASSGDSGYGVEFPAASGYVTAVGGTTLSPNPTTTRGWAETVWSGAGSGCSSYIAKPAWQRDGGCARRTVADVAADADPNTGVAVYDSYAYHHTAGWLVFGGTSVASPIIAGVYALAGNATTATNPTLSGTGGYGSTPYANPASLYDITSGSNGSCGGSYLCTGTVGYDGPTGNGTPDGTGAF